MSHIFIYAIKTYQLLRRIFGQKRYCVFYPSCSEYTLGALQRYNFLHALYLSVARVFRCHPWQKNNFDPLK